MHLNSSDMKRFAAFSLKLVVAEPRAITNEDFRHSIREIAVAANRDITLDDRALRMTLSENEIARLDCRILGVRIANEKKMNRLVDFCISGNAKDDTVSCERSVERGERGALGCGKLRDVSLYSFAFR